MSYSLVRGIEQVKYKADKIVTLIAFGLTGLGVAVAMPLAASAATNTVVVTPGDSHGWVFSDDNGNGGSGQFVVGPGQAPLGSGSAELSLTAGNQGYMLGNGGFKNVRLLDVTALSYRTFVQAGNNTAVPALQINIDTDLTDAHTGWQGRLVYEPYYTHQVTDGAWQAWNTMDNARSGANGNWWFSDSGAAATSGCTQAKPCTWDDVLAEFPNIGVNTEYPGILFKAGSNWPVPFTGNIDAFTLGINNEATVYDFEPTLTPTDRSSCRNGDWQAFNTPSFGSQGACVAWVEHNILGNGEAQ